MGMLANTVALLMLTASPAVAPAVGPLILPPTVNLSAIRPITCSDGSQGSGFYIKGDIIVTARHVVLDKNQQPLECKDAITKTPLKTYHTSKDQDFALMKPQGPLFIYYPLEYDCQPYKKGPASLYGWRPESYRQNDVIVSNDYEDVAISDDWPVIKHTRVLKGQAAAGMSGGAGIQNGYVRGIVNAEAWNFLGIVITVNSVELKDTVLCDPTIPSD